MVILPFVETPCGYAVPENRECSGSRNVDKQVCKDCPLYTERPKQESRFFTQKGRVFGEKKPNVFYHGRIRLIQKACGVTVEAVT